MLRIEATQQQQSTQNSGCSSSQSEDTNASLIPDLAKKNLPQNTPTGSNLKKRTRPIENSSSSKQQKTTSDSTPTGQQVLQASLSKAQEGNLSVHSSSENEQYNPRVSNAVENSSTSQPKTPNPLENAALSLQEKIFKVLNRGGAKTVREIADEFPEHETSAIQKPLNKLCSQGKLNRVKRTLVKGKPYEYSMLTINNEDPSKASNQIPSVQLTQTTALLQLAPSINNEDSPKANDQITAIPSLQKIDKKLNPLDEEIIKILKNTENPNKTSPEITRLINQLGFEVKLRTVQKRLKILSKNGIIGKYRIAEKNVIAFQYYYIPPKITSDSTTSDQQLLSTSLASNAVEVEHASTLPKKKPNPPKTTNLSIREKILKILNQGEAKTVREITNELTEHKSNSIQKEFKKMHSDGEIIRTKRTNVIKNSYEYSVSYPSQVSSALPVQYNTNKELDEEIPVQYTNNELDEKIINLLKTSENESKTSTEITELINKSHHNIPSIKVQKRLKILSDNGTIGKYKTALNSTTFQYYFSQKNTSDTRDTIFSTQTTTTSTPALYSEEGELFYLATAVSTLFAEIIPEEHLFSSEETGTVHSTQTTTTLTSEEVEVYLATVASNILDAIILEDATQTGPKIDCLLSEEAERALCNSSEKVNDSVSKHLRHRDSGK